jgi:hypothetical protein
MFVWTEIDGKRVFVDDAEIDPCKECNNPIGFCQENNCVEAYEDYGCVICGAERSSRCRCDYSYEQWAGK